MSRVNKALPNDNKDGRVFFKSCAPYFSSPVFSIPYRSSGQLLEWPTAQLTQLLDQFSSRVAVLLE